MDFFKRKVLSRSSTPPFEKSADKEKLRFHSVSNSPSRPSLSRGRSSSQGTTKETLDTSVTNRGRSSSFLSAQQWSNSNLNSYDSTLNFNNEKSPRAMVGKVKKKVNSSVFSKQKRPSSAGVNRAAPVFLDSTRFESFDSQRTRPSEVDEFSDHEIDPQSLELLDSPSFRNSSSNSSSDNPANSNSSTFPRKKSSVQSLKKNLKSALLEPGKSNGIGGSSSADVPLNWNGGGNGTSPLKKKSSIGRIREVKNSLTSGSWRREKELKEEDIEDGKDHLKPFDTFGGKTLGRKRSKSALGAQEVGRDQTADANLGASRSVDTTGTITISGRHLRTDSFGAPIDAPIIEQGPFTKDNGFRTSTPASATSSNEQYESPISSRNPIASGSRSSFKVEDSSNFDRTKPEKCQAEKNLQRQASKAGPKPRASLPTFSPSKNQYDSAKSQGQSSRPRASTTTSLGKPDFASASIISPSKLKNFTVLTPQDFRRRRFTDEEMKPENRRARASQNPPVSPSSRQSILFDRSNRPVPSPVDSYFEAKKIGSLSSLPSSGFHSLTLPRPRAASQSTDHSLSNSQSNSVSSEEKTNETLSSFEVRSGLGLGISNVDSGPLSLEDKASIGFTPWSCPEEEGEQEPIGTRDSWFESLEKQPDSRTFAHKNNRIRSFSVGIERSTSSNLLPSPNIMDSTSKVQHKKSSSAVLFFSKPQPQAGPHTPSPSPGRERVASASTPLSSTFQFEPSRPLSPTSIEDLRASPGSPSGLVTRAIRSCSVGSDRLPINIPTTPPASALRSSSPQISGLPFKARIRSGSVRFAMDGTSNASEETLIGTVQAYNDQVKAVVFTMLEVVTSNLTSNFTTLKKSLKNQLPAILKDSNCFPSNLPPQSRQKSLPFILPHLIHLHLYRNIVEPFCSGLPPFHNEHHQSLLKSVKNQASSPAEIFSWIKITHSSLRSGQSLFDRNSFVRNKLTELQNLICLLLVWNGNLGRIKDGLNLMSSSYEGLKEAFNLLDRAMVMLRQEVEGEYEVTLASDQDSDAAKVDGKNSSSSSDVFSSNYSFQSPVTLSVGLALRNQNGDEKSLIAPDTFKVLPDGNLVQYSN